ncbi:unnamed protein product [Nippostrongylus brasiliensis]|uniref:PHD-type domain-containing protein n=1 Tax=Nippostrongylus brasiliensis TaxID=27835 RepID=A0A0N4XV38_NIPBR|nr:unnamed protein product [Nippostrongylus brasiliensis]
MSPATGIGFTAPYSVDHRSSSLPRHFTRGGFGSSAHASPHSFGVRAPIISAPAYGFAPPPGQYHDHLKGEMVPVQPTVVPDEITGDPDLDDSVRCTRSVSAASLGSELPNTSVGWQSCLDTAANSNRMSPVSPSDLPDSPTQCAKMVPPKGDHSTPLSVSVRGGSRAASSSEPQSGLTASDTTTAIIDDQPTPTFPAFVLHPQGPTNKLPSPKDREVHQASSIDDVYAGVNLNAIDGNDLLTRSIEAELPQPSPRSATPKQQRRLADDRLLADMIESAQPSPRKSRHSFGDPHRSPNVDADRLLSACIDAAMPQPSPSYKSSSKNEKGGRGCSPVTHCVRRSPPLAGHLATAEDFEASISGAAFHDDINSPPHCASESWSDNDSEGTDQPDITLPVDCFIDDDITIDCSRIRLYLSFSFQSHEGSSPAVHSGPTPMRTGARTSFGVKHKTRLPKPTHNRASVQKISRDSYGAAPKKGAQAAVVTPYNYRKPEAIHSDSATEKSGIEKQSGKAVNPGKMLITTV